MQKSEQQNALQNSQHIQNNGLSIINIDQYIDEFVKISNNLQKNMQSNGYNNNNNNMNQQQQIDQSNGIKPHLNEQLYQLLNSIIRDIESKYIQKIGELSKLIKLISETNDKLKQEREETNKKLQEQHKIIQELEMQLVLESKQSKAQISELKEEFDKEINLKRLEDIERQQLRATSDKLLEENIKLKQQIEILQANNTSKEKLKQLTLQCNRSEKRIDELTTERKMLASANENLLKQVDLYIRKLQQSEAQFQDELKKREMQIVKTYESKVQYMERQYLAQTLNPLQKNSSEYDVVVMIYSILEVMTGWKIKTSLNFQQKTLQDTIVVGIAGLANKGKTFLANKLCNENFISGFHVKTEGLSMKYAKDETKIVSVLDTAGYETPIAFYAQKQLQMKEGESKDQDEVAKQAERIQIKEKYRDKLNERISTEDFLQKFILESSNIILIVVGQLTYSDQKLISRISLKFSKKKIVIVHNLHDICFIESVKEKVITDIIEAFDVKEMIFEFEVDYQCNKKIWYENKQTEEGEAITHVILARENTEAGDYYNTSTLEHLKNLMKTQSKFQKFDLIQSLVQYSQKDLSQYLELAEEGKNSKDHQKPENFNVVYDPEKKIIKLLNKGVFKMRTVYFDSFGNLLKYQNSNEYIPDYSLVEYDDYIECILDMPGHFTSLYMDKYVENDKHILIIQGERDTNADVGSEFLRKISGERKSGRIDLLIQLVDTKTSLGEPKKKTYENGVLKIYIEKIKRKGPIHIDL